MADAPPTPPDPLCAFCGDEVPAMNAIIYHGVVYHPACVASTTGRATHTDPPPGDAHPSPCPRDG